MFGRKKDSEPQPQASTHVEREGAKNRPTPKRREAQAQNRRQVVPTDRKAAAAAERARMREERARTQTALAAGDERHFPARDAGPVRRLVRDVVDARFGVGELYLPLVVLLLVMMFLPGLLTKDVAAQSRWISLTTAVLYVFVLATAVDTFLMWRTVKKQLKARFGEGQPTNGLFGYAFTRSVQLRRFRRPPVAVSRRQAPRL